MQHFLLTVRTAKSVSKVYQSNCR